MKNHYTTANPGEAAFLYESNQKLIQVKHSETKCRFIFENKQRCEEVIKQYWPNKRNEIIEDLAILTGRNTK